MIVSTHIVALQYSIVLVLVMVAAFTDVWKGLIYNWLTLPAIVIGLGLSVYQNGWAGAVASFFGILIGGGTLFIPFSFGVMGGGDVKLMAAIGALMGPLFTVETLIVSILVGGCTGMVLMIARGKLLPTLTWYLGCLKTFARVIFFKGTVFSLPKSPEVGTAPFGVSILVGAGVAFYYDVLACIRLW